ncbi:DUF3054 domain-containing protein [Pseudonocardia ailaonensis]|uniref:DUF3054 domain-containing protein n=1 Tax=Pseudonocardia ailaonensis TaxID=367279 RepID=A0ABN2MJL1_9PSEU
MRRPRIPVLALAADVVAVVVFAAIGRASHEEADSLVGLAATAAPFLAGLVAAWATPWVRARPASVAAGGIVLAGTAVIGLLLRFAFLDRLPLSFAIVATVSLAVLLLGWRGLAALVALRSRRRTPAA